VPGCRVNLTMPKKGTHRLVRQTLRLVAAKNLRQLMAANADDGLETYTQVAETAKVGRNTVKRLYLAQTGVTLDTLEAVASVFDAYPWQLLVEGMRPGEMPSLAAPSAKEKALYARMTGLEAKIEALSSPTHASPVKRPTK